MDFCSFTLPCRLFCAQLTEWMVGDTKWANRGGIKQSNPTKKAHSYQSSSFLCINKNCWRLRKVQDVTEVTEATTVRCLLVRGHSKSRWALDCETSPCYLSTRDLSQTGSATLHPPVQEARLPQTYWHFPEHWQEELFLLLYTSSKTKISQFLSSDLSLQSTTGCIFAPYSHTGRRCKWIPDIFSSLT